MTVRRFRKQLAAGVGVLSLVLSAVPARAQWTVFDPSNFSQNVLTAARTLQQINNQITSLQNEAQGLINQARNLANLPYSSLQALEQNKLIAPMLERFMATDRAFSKARRTLPAAPATTTGVSPGAPRPAGEPN